MLRAGIKSNDVKNMKICEILEMIKLRAITCAHIFLIFLTDVNLV